MSDPDERIRLKSDLEIYLGKIQITLSEFEETLTHDGHRIGELKRALIDRAAQAVSDLGKSADAYNRVRAEVSLKRDVLLSENTEYEEIFTRRRRRIRYIMIGPIVVFLLTVVEWILYLTTSVVSIHDVLLDFLVLDPIIIASVITLELRARLFSRHIELNHSTENQVIEQFQEKMQKAEDRFSDAVSNSQIEFSRTFVNNYLKASYSCDFELRSTTGLNENQIDTLRVPTTAHKELLQLMESMSGGSVGIAGNRGTGKSTLIRYLCSSSSRLGAFQPITALVTAPVDYEPREFMLHLYSAICSSIVGPNAVTRIDSSENERFVERTSLRRNGITRQLIAFVSLIGLFIVVAGAILIFEKAKGSSTFTGIGLVLAGSLTFLASLLVLFDNRRQSSSNSDPAINRIDIHFNRNFFPVTDMSPFEVDKLPSIQKSAIAGLREILFERSTSKTWAGSFHVPVASLEIGGTDTWVRRHSTYPELVSSVRNLLAEVTRELPGRSFVVGIDELDKIESPEKARSFINDLKAVFGVPNVYFLVSVSLDAMASFGKRGNPFRDEFDSAFDEVLEIGAFTFAESQVLLNRRTIGLPVPFSILAHSISGGLPRDLIRCVRRLVILSKSLGALDIRLASRQLLNEEVASRSRSITFLLSRDGVFVSSTILEIGQGWQNLVTSKDFLDCASAIHREALTRSELLPQDFRLYMDLTHYLYFAATVIDILGDCLDEAKYEEIQSDIVDRLAMCRHALSINLSMAILNVNGIRSDLSLPVIDLALKKDS